MKETLRNGLILFCYLFGIASLRNNLIHRRGRTITRIVAFHKVKDLVLFEHQIRFLIRHFHVVSLKDFLLGHVSGDRINVVVTFDDGYRSWLSAIPVLQRYQIPAVFFVSSAYIDATDLTQQEIFCAEHLGVQAEPSLCWDELRNIAHEKGFDIGGHTMHHVSLGEMTDLNIVKREILEDKHHIEEKIGRPVSFFAYPFGHPPSFNHQVASVVREAGYKCALTLIPGINDEYTGRFILHRDCVDELRMSLLLKAWLYGGYDPFKWMLVSFHNLKILK